MTRIWTGTASVVSGYTTVHLSGDPLSDANCPVDATIVLGGETYFVSERVNTTDIELTRVYAGADNATISAEIDPMTPATTSLVTISSRVATLNSQLTLLDANGRGLFYKSKGDTGANDPGPGYLGRNADDWADVGALYFDILDQNGQDITDQLELLTSGDILIVRSIATNAVARVQVITTSNETGWFLVGVIYLGGSDLIADEEDLAVEWRRMGTGITTDAQAATPADLFVYENQALGYSVLVGDYSDGRAAVVTLLEGGSPATWSDPAFVGGPRGISGAAATITVGDVTTLPAGSEATVDNSGTPSAAILDFAIPRGEPGADGTDPGVLLIWDTGTSDADPGAGKVRANSPSAPTVLYVSKTNRAGSSIAAFLAALDDSTSADKGGLLLTKTSDDTQVAGRVTGNTDASGYVKVALSGMPAIGFSAADPISLQFSATGEAGTGAVSSVNGASGVVVLDAGDLAVTPTGGISSTDVQAALAEIDGEKLAKAGGTMVGDLVLAGDPDSNLKAATKQYVDTAAANAAAGVAQRGTVRVATTANITIATALNNGDSLDSVSLANGDLVLVKDQSSAAENGVYVVGASPARSAQFDTYDEHPGALIVVEEGTANADTFWYCTSNKGGTLNSTAIAWSQMAVSLADGSVTNAKLANMANATFKGRVTSGSGAPEDMTVAQVKALTAAPRVGTTASSTTPTPDADSQDQYTVTALSAGATFGAPTGTPVDGQKLLLRIKDNGGARSLAFNAIYRAIGIVLPTTTVISKVLYLGCIYNSAATKWDVIATSQEA